MKLNKNFYKSLFLDFKEKDGEVKNQSVEIYLKRVFVFVFFGFIPILLIRYWLKQPLRIFGYGFRNVKSTIIFTLLLYLVSFPVVLIASRSLQLQSVYPEIRESIKSKIAFFFNLLSYIFFYFGYESLYRGFLLFGLRDYVGEWFAIIISMGFVSVSHIRAPGSVFLGSVVSGFIFPWINFRVGSIWPVFFAHTGIGISMDYLCLRKLQVRSKILVKD